MLFNFLFATFSSSAITSATSSITTTPSKTFSPFPAFLSRFSAAAEGTSFFFFFFFLVSCCSCCFSLQLDIHLKLQPSSCLYQIANETNYALRLHSPNTESISFQQTRISLLQHQYKHNNNQTSLNNTTRTTTVNTTTSTTNRVTRSTTNAGDWTSINSIRKHHPSLPHITLYLSDFQIHTVSNITRTLTELISKGDICTPSTLSPFFTSSAGGSKTTTSTSATTIQAADTRIDVDGILIQGPYSMYHIHNTPYFQHLSDTIVLHSHPYTTPNQTIPDWVFHLPEPERSIKIDYVRRYGSPNVFEEFDPHLTVGYDEVASSDERRQILEEYKSRMDFRDCIKVCDGNSGAIVGNTDPWVIAIGIVGDWGTVLEDVWVMPLKDCEEYSSTEEMSSVL